MRFGKKCTPPFPAAMSARGKGRFFTQYGNSVFGCFVQLLCFGCTISKARAGHFLRLSYRALKHEDAPGPCAGFDLVRDRICSQV